MTFRQLLRLVVSLLVVSTAQMALAAPRDAATLKKIDEALNVHYLAADYDKAELTLQYAVKACGTKYCTREILAKTYVALGVVLGNAKQDLAGARAAFENARGVDPSATLDAALVTPQVLKEFYKVMGRELPPELAKPPADTTVVEEKGPKAPPRVSPAGDLRCTPVSGYEIRTAQPIAVVCEPLEGVVRAELYYRFAGEPEYAAILMSIQDGTLRANIPCERLTKPGKLEVYIIAQDFNKEMIDTFGNIVTPAHYMIVKETKLPAPTYPGQPAPPRCAEVQSSAGMAGQSCDAERACRSGLYCATGTCTAAPKCETADDCESKQCNEGSCQIEDTYAEETPNTWMVGLHAGLDLWFASSVKQVCGEPNILAGNFNCYNAGEDKVYVNREDDPTTPVREDMNTSTKMVDEGGGGNIAAGVRLATMRAMLSVDRVLTPHLSVGGRVGWAFLGGPRTIHFTDGEPKQRTPFFPGHIELRGTLWLRSLGIPRGFHPYIGLGGGVAEVDAKIPINGRYMNQPRQLDAWRKMGMMFVAGSIGGLYRLSRHHGVQLNINAMYMFTAKGTVFEPSLGYVFGF